MTTDLNPEFQTCILKATGATSLQVAECIQELWSGYGQILRIELEGAAMPSIIVKHVRVPTQSDHPRGWNSNLSHERKLKSYEVEPKWYRDWSASCGRECRVATLLAHDEQDGEVMIVLEDLDAAGFPLRLNSVNDAQLAACLDWLAHFHATFLGEKPAGLWETGTYWHLATRPDELEALDDAALQQAAPKLDAMLSGAKFQTLVHGDAKLANFCFSTDGKSVAAVDFQYVGGGCGMKDLAYFMGSCLDEEACEAREEELLDHYFGTLRHALATKQPSADADALEQEWRTLFPVAWTDFHRFLKGWSPGHWKINSYSERVSREVLASL